MSTTFDTAERAFREYEDTRTRSQRRWDEHAEAAQSLTKRLRDYVWIDPMWSRKPEVLELVSALSSDLERELKALRIMGFRDGDAVGPIPELKPVTAQARLPAPVAGNDDERGSA